MRNTRGAGERISAEATEYVRGIPVVKVFQQTVFSFKHFHDAILSYCDLASGYSMTCRMPYTLFTVVMNSMFLLLMPLGMLLIGGAANGWAVLRLGILYFLRLSRPHDGAADVCGQRKDGGRRGSEEARDDPEGNRQPEPAPAGRKSPADSSISFDNVTFTYDGAARPALMNVHFHLPQGAAYALVGPSGGGKSTIARLDSALL